MQKSSIIISLGFLVTGFVSAYFIFGQQAPGNLPQTNMADSRRYENKTQPANPFAVHNDETNDAERLSYLEAELSSMKQQLHEMNLAIQDVAKTVGNESPVTRPGEMLRQRFTSALNQRLYSLDNLVRGGIDASLAEDIVRRKNSVELKRLALQDRARREDYLNTQRYYDELAEINAQDVSLREELGDDRYDEYLYNSKQNNRIRISSVMLGSAAEQAGIQKGDIVLSYDNKRLFTWQELKDATAAGELGEYVALNIYRNGEIFSFSVPRGPLGIQLGATRLAP